MRYTMLILLPKSFSFYVESKYVQCAYSSSHRIGFSWIFVIHLGISYCTKIHARYLEKDK